MPPPAYAKKALSWWCVFGAVSVTERVWRTEQKGYVRLLPEAIGVTPRGRSQRLERVLTDFGCEHAFQHGAARVVNACPKLGVTPCFAGAIWLKSGSRPHSPS